MQNNELYRTTIDDALLKQIIAKYEARNSIGNYSFETGKAKQY
jgi:hypothetical protein